MDVLNLPRPGWMTEELALLEQQVRRFIAAEYVPHLDRWNEQGMYERDVWNKAGDQIFFTLSFSVVAHKLSLHP